MKQHFRFIWVAVAFIATLAWASAGTLLITDGSFEDVSNGSGTAASSGGDTFYRALDDWFEEAEDGTTSADAGTEVAQNKNANTNIPDTSNGTFWANLVPQTLGDTAAIYQSLGIWNTGDAVSVTLTALLGDRSNAAFADVTFELARTDGASAGADGTALSSLTGFASMDTQAFGITETTSPQSVSTGEFTLDITGVSDGDRIWLRMSNANTINGNTQSLIDNVVIVPEPSSALLLTGGLLALVMRRRRQ